MKNAIILICILTSHYAIAGGDSPLLSDWFISHSENPCAKLNSNTASFYLSSNLERRYLNNSGTLNKNIGADGYVTLSKKLNLKLGSHFAYGWTKNVEESSFGVDVVSDFKVVRKGRLKVYLSSSRETNKYLTVNDHVLPSNIHPQFGVVYNDYLYIYPSDNILKVLMFNTGFLYEGTNLSMGFAVNNITEPNYSLYRSSDSVLPRELIGFASYIRYAKKTKVKYKYTLKNTYVNIQEHYTEVYVTKYKGKNWSGIGYALNNGVICSIGHELFENFLMEATLLVPTNKYLIKNMQNVQFKIQLNLII